MNLGIFLLLFWPTLVFSQDYFSLEKILEQYTSQGLDYLQIENKDYNLVYEINRDKEFEVKDWYIQDWAQLQKNVHFSQEKYIYFHQGESFNDAKRKYYKNLPFLKTFRYAHIIPPLKEWGGLNHPPVTELSIPIDKVDTRLAETKVNGDHPFFKENFQEDLDSISKSELSFNNEVKSITDHQSYLGKIELIRNAKKTIWISSLVMVCDKSTQQITDELIKKKHQGLDIRVIVDGLVSTLLKHKKCVKQLQQNNIQAMFTGDAIKYNRITFFHSKMVLVDSEVAIAGGQNFIDADHLSQGVNFMNRDVDLLIRGPLVTDMYLGFIKFWNYHQKKKAKRKQITPIDLSDFISTQNTQTQLGLRGKAHYKKILSNPKSRMKGVCRFVPQSPYDSQEVITETYIKLLSEAQDQLYITDPMKIDKIKLKNKKFKNYNKLHQALFSFIKSGKKADLLTSSINLAGNENSIVLNEKIKIDILNNKNLSAGVHSWELNLLNKFFGSMHFRHLFEDWVIYPNLQVWAHMSFLHSKVFYVDRLLASVGSFNLSQNSTDASYESTVLCMDESLNKELDKMLAIDMVNSMPIFPK